VKRESRLKYLGQRGVAALELALIVPIMLVLAFAIIDFGRFIQARLVVANLSREGGSLASRDIDTATGIITMLQSGGSPLNMANDGRIYIWKIRAGTGPNSPDPYIDQTASAQAGALSVASTIGIGQANLGLTPQLYNHLEYDNAQKAADISDVTVVEVFFNYTPLTPLMNFVPNLFPAGGTIMASKAVF